MKRLRKTAVTVLTISLVLSTAMPVSATHWADKHYDYLKSSRILNQDFGDAPENGKNQPITRAEFFALTVSALYGRQEQVAEENSSEENHFADFSEVQPELTGYMTKAYTEKILTGTESNGELYILPSQPISRQEAATVIGRALRLSFNMPPGFSDRDSIQDYARDYVAACEKTAIISGYPNGEFQPTGSITWAESVKIVSAAMEGRLAEPRNVTVTVGNAVRGNTNGETLISSFSQPSAAVFLGGTMYIADTGNNKIRKLENGRVSDAAGTILGYDFYNEAVGGYRDDKVDKALFSVPSDITVSEERLVIADSKNNSIRMIYQGEVKTIAGMGKAGYKDGKRTEALFSRPEGICSDSSGNIYVADTGNQVIRKIDKEGNVTTLAGQPGKGGYGDGSLENAQFNVPSKLAWAAGVLYVSDRGNNRIRMIKDGQVSTLAGSGTETYNGTDDFMGGYRDGEALKAEFSNPQGICVASDGTVYVADTGNAMIRGIKDGKVFTVAGIPRQPMEEQDVIENDFVSPMGLCLLGNTLYITDSLRNTVSSVSVK